MNQSIDKTTLFEAKYVDVESINSFDRLINETNENGSIENTLCEEGTKVSEPISIDTLPVTREELDNSEQEDTTRSTEIHPQSKGPIDDESLNIMEMNKTSMMQTTSQTLSVPSKLITFSKESPERISNNALLIPYQATYSPLIPKRLNTKTLEEKSQELIVIERLLGVTSGSKLEEGGNSVNKKDIQGDKEKLVQTLEFVKPNIKPSTTLEEKSKDTSPSSSLPNSNFVSFRKSCCNIL